MSTMRDLVRRNDVHHWARSFLEHLESTHPAGGRVRAMGRSVILKVQRRVSALRH
jgi:trehalose-6-phosphate synthase